MADRRDGDTPALKGGRRDSSSVTDASAATGGDVPTAAGGGRGEGAVPASSPAPAVIRKREAAAAAGAGGGRPTRRAPAARWPLTHSGSSGGAAHAVAPGRGIMGKATGGRGEQADWR